MAVSKLALRPLFSSLHSSSEGPPSFENRPSISISRITQPSFVTLIATTTATWSKPILICFQSGRVAAPRHPHGNFDGGCGLERWIIDLSGYFLCRRCQDRQDSECCKKKNKRERNRKLPIRRYLQANLRQALEGNARCCRGGNPNQYRALQRARRREWGTYSWPGVRMLSGAGVLMHPQGMFRLRSLLRLHAGSTLRGCRNARKSQAASPDRAKERKGIHLQCLHRLSDRYRSARRSAWRSNTMPL